MYRRGSALKLITEITNYEHALPHSPLIILAHRFSIQHKRIHSLFKV